MPKTRSGPGRAPVMGDVAKAAGVSQQTVSRVLNGHVSVSPHTRTAVEKAIYDLGYRRNTAARNLVTGRSQTFGVLGSEISQYGPSKTLMGIERAAREAGYFVSITSLRQVTREAVLAAVTRFVDQGVDGIIVVVPHPGTLDVLHELSLEVPLVAIGMDTDERFTTISVNQRFGARLAVEHLVGLGHEKIAHISGPLGWIDSAARIEGWRDALTAAGLPEPPLIRGDWSAECGYRAGLDLARELPFTALFVANDQMALGLLRAFYESGIKVPLDVSVVGYDDQPEAAYFVPPLTTVNQDFEELGQRCIGAMLLELQFMPNDLCTVKEPRLVIRSTTTSPNV